MQHAQPVTLAHHVCAWAQMFARDVERLTDAYKRVDLSPIGSGALATSGLPLNREYEAGLLGFAGVTANSLDTVSDRDHYLEVALGIFPVIILYVFCQRLFVESLASTGVKM